ncbi:scoF, partial [Symbiodinium natans]
MWCLRTFCTMNRILCRHKEVNHQDYQAVNQDRCRDVIKTSAVLEEDIDGGRSLEREASEAKERLEPKEGIIRLKPPEAARGFPTSRVVTAASDESDQSPARETANAVEEDGWSPPPRPSMPAMPGPPGISGTADGIASTLPPSIVSMDSSLMEGSDDVDAELPRAESPAGPVEILPQGSRFGEPVLSVPAATPLVPFVLKGPPPSCTKEDRVKALKYAAVVPPSAKK